MLNIRYTTQMKRFFVFVSIILLLSSNIVLAIDSDCLGTPQQLSAEDLQQNTNPNDTDYTADNCCHSSMHFVAIYPNISNTYAAISKHYIALPFSLAESQTYQPPTPPPNV